ncbi:serine--tRNA ligase [Nakamurella antarctica]|uniref:Serine--tRNA ligase n=1 Tax=Nakamurella antarctica TaxID=1902245 RepID=A0A3G8ZIA1_9ACTN|nr:serine--tRNA ligase [Nakamurella antarctica]AZI57043.1 serine--tRNA ligase [Nakamurella antarctica]
MIDLRIVRDTPDIARTSQVARGADPAVVDRLVAADAARRVAVAAADELRAEQKAFGRTVGKATPAERPALLVRGKDLAASVDVAQATETVANAELLAAHKAIPNLISPEAPHGGEEDFVLIKHVGTPAEPDFPMLDHAELGEKLGAIDTVRGAKVSGARFYFLRGVGAQLQLAMLNLAISQALKHGFIPMIPPVLVKPESMDGTGFLGEHNDEVYHLPSDDLFLVGTSEVPMAAYHSGEILDLGDGPIRYAGWSSCFRREAGSYGKDTKGILRVHQFEKIEMFSYCRPEEAEAEHLTLLAMEEEMLGLMDVPYRVIDVAAGDLGTSAARKFDCEAWVPTQQAYRELTSTSNCTTFQARRLNVRYRDDDGKPQIAATLNGTLATTRWLVAILENHQQRDGSVKVPAALQPFMGGVEVMEPK